MPLPEDETEWKKFMVIFATANGNVRKNSLEDFININNSGKIAMKLDQDDKIIGVKICKDEEDILLSTQFGKCIRFKSKKLRLFKGRSSKGIKGIKLNDKDKVISLSVIDNSNISTKVLKKDKKIKNGVDNFILSTDSKKISRVANRLNCKTPFFRPRSISKDNSSSIELIIHALKYYINRNINYDYIVLLEPTSPLTTAFDIDKAIKMLHRKRSIADSIVGISKNINQNHKQKKNNNQKLLILIIILSNTILSILCLLHLYLENNYYI